MSHDYKLLFVSGMSRSGSTLLETVLTQLDEFTAVGELTYLWRWAFDQNLLCGCGQPFGSCSFWQHTLADAFDSGKGLDSGSQDELLQNVIRIRRLPQLIWPWSQSKNFQRDSDELADHLDRLYTSIAAQANAKVIVDSSKIATRGIFLEKKLSIPTVHVHLVRDPRAVAFSWRRKKVHVQRQGKDQSTMPQYSTFKSGGQWLYRNISSDIERLISENAILLRYEDVVRAPEQHLALILERLGYHDPIDTARSALVKAGNKVTTNHSIGGNPSKYRTSIKIEDDAAWKSALDKKTRLLTEVMTWPMMLKYGYFGRDKS